MMQESSASKEAVSGALEDLYGRFGYTRYKMNRFEEYDLYARNKDFLVSDNVITFTDTSGKLMALKPDVTLSIVKNARSEPGTISKLYYKESVYRVSARSRCFQELTQVGLEAIGEVDEYATYEVLKLAAESMARVGGSCVLEISHLGLLDTAIRYAGIGGAEADRAVDLIGARNFNALAELCRTVPAEKAAPLLELASLFGTPAEVLPRIRALPKGLADEDELGKFDRILTALSAGKYAGLIRIDFSVVGSLRYYSGIVFKGYVKGIPSAVLSGGQYDRLLQRMGRNDGAVGFAVYLDILDEYRTNRGEYDVDVLLVCDPGTPIAAVEARARELTEDGSSIQVQHGIPAQLRCRRIVKLGKGGEVL